MLIDAMLEGKTKDIGGFTVSRLLPHAERRAVGPFVFLDHIGPASFLPGHGLDVRPHPHIGLATVTYLFEGEIVHRDSLGSEQPIRPGAVNWMTAGAGIVHSERTASDKRASGPSLHGLQFWVALPQHLETGPADFVHHAAADIPEFAQDAAVLRLIAGRAYDAASPAIGASPLFYVHARFPRDGMLALPEGYAERALYVISGQMEADGRPVMPGRLVLFGTDAVGAVRAKAGTEAVLFGGAPLDGPRYLEWNFVASSRDLIEQAKARWRAGAFPRVPGETDFIPLP